MTSLPYSKPMMTSFIHRLYRCLGSYSTNSDIDLFVYKVCEMNISIICIENLKMIGVHLEDFLSGLEDKKNEIVKDTIIWEDIFNALNIWKQR